MEKEKRGLAAWLKERIRAISAVLGNLAARIILGKKGFNEAYQMNLKNSIAKDMQNKTDAYKDRKMNEPSEEQKTEKQVNPMEQTEESGTITEPADLSKMSDSADTADTGTIFVRTVPKDNQDINLNEDRYIKCGFIPATKETMYIDTEAITPHMTSLDLQVPKENMGIFIGKKGANIKKAEAALKQAFPNLEKINTKEYIPERENNAPEPDVATAKNISVKNNNGVINTGNSANIINTKECISERENNAPEPDAATTKNISVKNNNGVINTGNFANIIYHQKEQGDLNNAGHDNYDELQTMETMEKAGVVSPHTKKLYQLAKEHSSEIIKIMDKAAPELKENQDLRVELEDLDLIISKAGESGELRAVIQEKGQDGEIIMSSQDMESFAAGDIEQHARDEEILKGEEKREEQARREETKDIFEGFLDEDVPMDVPPPPEGTFDVLDMNIQSAQESEREIDCDVADAGCQDFGDRM